MRPRSYRHTFGVLLAATLVIVGTLAALVPITDAGVIVRRTRSTRTDREPSKKVFVSCPPGWTATGGGAQAFATEYATVSGGIANATGIVIFQIIPNHALTGYGARAQAVEHYPFPWHLTVYVICARLPQDSRLAEPPLGGPRAGQ